MSGQSHYSPSTLGKVQTIFTFTGLFVSPNHKPSVHNCIWQMAISICLKHFLCISINERKVDKFS